MNASCNPSPFHCAAFVLAKVTRSTRNPSPKDPVFRISWNFSNLRPPPPWRIFFYYYFGNSRISALPHPARNPEIPKTLANLSCLALWWRCGLILRGNSCAKLRKKLWKIGAARGQPPSSNGRLLLLEGLLPGHEPLQGTCCSRG